MKKLDCACYVQSRDHIKMYCATYIDKILNNHGWNTPVKEETKLIEALHPDSIKKLERTACQQNESESRKIEDDMGFSYRSAIGELSFAYVLCRLGIGYAMADLSKFSQNPARCHYVAVKRVVRYLRKTKDWVMVFWRK